jgi:eukaryotic-like serine/threonine-protein kinase
MRQEHWRRVEDLFHAALEREPESRRAFLDEACAGDADLRQQVERLLAQGEQAGSFLEHPAIDGTAASASAGSLLGQQFGPYRILSLLGSGGMGQVYKAHDSRLNRSVAVKVCAAEFSGRFAREARAIAALNHPNICQLYDVGPNYLVMELVEGPTLAERLKQSPVPLEEALAIAKQIAEAIEAAHEKGIVHRDLKPGNIKLRPDGAVKVLDFGLAKVEQSRDPSRDLTPSRDREGADPDNSPTLTMEAATHLGTILGTAPYMSPEQALGKPVDKRADIWSFGAVLYEMLSGQRAFTGESTTEILAAVVKSEPDLTRVPMKVQRVIEACLQKDPKQRLRDIADAWKLLDDSAELTADSGSGLWRRPPGLRTWQARTPAPLAIAALLAIALAVAGASWWRATRPTNRPLARLDIDLGSEVTLPNLARSTHTLTLSPDGTRLLYLSGNPPRLYTRRLDQSRATELPGTDYAQWPFFSPDGQGVGFFTGYRLNKISVEGGAVVPLADFSSCDGGKLGRRWQHHCGGND